MADPTWKIRLVNARRHGMSQQALLVLAEEIAAALAAAESSLAEARQQSEMWADRWKAAAGERDAALCERDEARREVDDHQTAEMTAWKQRQEIATELAEARREREALMLEMNRAKDEARAYWGERDEAREALRAAAWTGWSMLHDEACCVQCGCRQSEGHDSECLVGRALASGTKADKEG